MHESLKQTTAVWVTRNSTKRRRQYALSLSFLATLNSFTHTLLQVSQSVSQSVGQSVSRSVSQSVSQSVSL